MMGDTSQDAAILLRRRRAAMLAEEIRRRRLTPEEAAEKSRLSVHQINRVLSGKVDNIPSPLITDALSRITGSTICSC